MNQLLQLLMGSLKAEKGRDVNRTLVLAGIVYLIVQVNGLKEELANQTKQIAAIETRLAVARIAKVEVGPDWPKNAAAALRQ